jgi:hypothetical protein
MEISGVFLQDVVLSGEIVVPPEFLSKRAKAGRSGTSRFPKAGLGETS